MNSMKKFLVAIAQAVPIPNGPGKISRWYWTAIDYRTGGLVRIHDRP
jgi:hypothetical protein